jgi:uncharacterized protein YggE
MTGYHKLNVPQFSCPLMVAYSMIPVSCRMNVEGRGSIFAEPDRASVVLGVITENLQLEAAQNENSLKVQKVIQALLDSGVKREDIKTSNYQISPQYDFVNGEQVFRGYRVVHELAVVIENIRLIGVIIDNAVRAGANTVSDIRFFISDTNVYYQAALNAYFGHIRTLFSKTSGQ